MKTGRKGGPTARDDVHHPVHSASRGLTRRLRIDYLGYKDSVGDKNRKWLYRWEFLVYFILVPAILVAIQYLVPYPIKDKYFILHINNPTPWAMFLTNYVHTDDPLHLWGNMAVYLCFIGALPLFNRAPPNPHGWIKKHRLLFELYFFVMVPFAVSAISLFALRNRSGTNILGFSGVDAALIGYFTGVSYYIYGSYKDMWFFIFGTFAIVIFSLLMVVTPIIGIFSNTADDYPNIIGHIGGFLCGTLPVPLISYFERGARNA